MASPPVPASFRDPSGFVFERDGVLFRQVHRSYAAHYDRLLRSGLYDELVRRGLLVSHEEVEAPPADDGDVHVVLRPERIPFVSHPYEWCFGQLRDAALLTLEIQLTALRFGMSLKDASAYNVQLHEGRPIFIDTLSFEIREEGRPWTGYRQFCQHFLAPLALMALRDVRLAGLLRSHLDGVPLDLASSLLPLRARLRVPLLLHLFLHARFQRRHVGEEAASRARAQRVGTRALENIVSTLRRAVEGLKWEPRGTVWADYYAGDSYSQDAFARKRELVAAHLDRIRPGVVWDLGANTGAFSRLASERGARVVALDGDPAAVERCYRDARERRDGRLLPLVADLANPSPGLGWAHAERSSLMERADADLVLALALVHHLAIAGNVPLDRVADLLAALGEHLVIEFVPKSDPKVRTLLASREDVFSAYHREGFETAFGRRFRVLEATPLEGSERILYRMQRRTPAA